MESHIAGLTPYGRKTIKSPLTDRQGVKLGKNYIFGRIINIKLIIPLVGCFKE